MVEVGNMGSDQLLHGTDDPHGLDGLGVTTMEVPVHSPPRASVLADDGSRRDDPADTAISVHLQTDELPFQQPNPNTIPVAPAAPNWKSVITGVDKRPLAALGVAVVLAVVFAAFISRNGQSPSSDDDTTDGPIVSESASATAGADQLADTPTRAELGADSLTSGVESADPFARSTGTLGPGEGSGFFSGLVVEPDRSLTGTDIDWTPTTVAPSSTATSPSTATTSSTTATSPSTATTALESTTTVPSTSSTATTPEPEGPWVRAIGPGTADAQNPVTVDAGRVTLEAEGSDRNMRFRFFVFVKDEDGDWQQIARSRWRSRSSWTIGLDGSEGRTMRWTVVGVAGFRNLTDESAPLYLRIAGGEDGDQDD